MFATQKKGVVKDDSGYQQMKGFENPNMHRNNTVAEDV